MVYFSGVTEGRIPQALVRPESVLLPPSRSPYTPEK